MNMLRIKSIARLLLSLSPLLLVSLSLSAQYYDVCYPGKGYPVILRLYDGKEMQKIVIPDDFEKPFFRVEGKDATYDFDLSFINGKEELPPPDNRHEFIEWIDPGVPVEGDLPSHGAYSKDGSIFAFCYQHSDNVIFYNATTYEILATVQVPEQPLYLKMGENYAYVCCHKGQCAVAISLDDFSISNYIPVDGTPCQIELSPGEDTAYIGCGNFYNSLLVAFDLNTNQVIYQQSVPSFHHYGWGGGLGRKMYYLVKFKLSPKGDQFIGGYHGWPGIFNAHTGNLTDSLTFGGWRGSAYSPTGDTLYVYSNREDTVMMYRMNTADLSVIDSIWVTASCWTDMVSYSDLAINHDGSRVLVNDWDDSRYCLFDFNTGTCQIIPEDMLYFDSPTYASFDGKYGITATMTEVHFIDFETGEVYNTWPTGVNTGSPLCVSPKGENLVVGNLPDYNWSSNDNETLYSINFKYIDNIHVDTAIICGALPEADVSACADLSNDGKKILSANSLTFNLSVIDYDEHLTDTIVNINYITGIKVVPGSDVAITYGDDSGMSRIISLTDYSILAELITNPVKEAFVTSDGQTGFLIRYSGNAAIITKINIDGASSSIIDVATVGYSRTSMTYIVQECTLYTTGALSPDGQLLLFGYNDPQLGRVINIVDTETLDLLTSVSVPVYEIFGFAFTEDSKRVVAVGMDYHAPIIYLDGENSYVENMVLINGESFSADYNPVDGLFYILEKNSFIHKVDPLTGNIIESVPTYDNYSLRIKIDQKGMPMVLTTSSLIYDREVYAMPGVSTVLNYYSENDLFICPVPGPDVVCVFDPKMVGIQQLHPGKENEISIFPNPAIGQIFIKSAEEITRVKVCNIAGGEVYSGDFTEGNIEIPVGNLAPGVYVIDITTKEGNYSRKMVRK
jgi:hypothetical protein